MGGDPQESRIPLSFLPWYFSETEISLKKLD